MCLRQVKPTTSSQRQLIQINYGKLTKAKPVRSLLKGLSNSGGRNHQGRLQILVYNKGQAGEIQNLKYEIAQVCIYLSISLTI